MAKTKNGISKKVLVFILTIACVVAFTPIMSMPQNAGAASKTSKLTISGAASVTAGKTVTYKASTKPKTNAKNTNWKSGNKDIAKVSASKGSKITVKGLTAGTTKIIACNGTKKVVKKITVKGFKITKATLNKTIDIKVGDTLKATVKPSAATKNALYIWYVGGKAPNDQDFNSTWTVTSDMIGKTIYCEVTGQGMYKGSTIKTNVTEAVKGEAITSATLSKTTNVKVGDTLSVTLDPASAQKHALYMWYVDKSAPDDQNFESTWTVTDAMVGKTIYCKVIGQDLYKGSTVKTVATDVVQGK